MASKWFGTAIKRLQKRCSPRKPRFYRGLLHFIDRILKVQFHRCKMALLRYKGDLNPIKLNI